MDRPEFLELVLGSRSDVVVEQWDVERRKVTRATLSFEEACKVDGEEIFFHPKNGQTLTLASDTDDRETTLPPSVKTETFTSRYDSFFRFQEPLSTSEIETLQNYLDPMSPPRLTQTFRMPGTTSTKHGVPFTIQIAESTGHIYTPAQVFALEIPQATVTAVDPSWIREPGPFEAGNRRKALLWLQKRAKPVGKNVRAQMEKANEDPKGLLRKLIKNGLSEQEAIWCVEAAACNPFRHWRYGAREELAKMLLITRVQSGSASVAAAVTAIRSASTAGRKPFVIRNLMAARALEDFDKNATVLRATDGTRWAIDRATGNAMELIHGSEPIRHYIARRYGINPVDMDHRHLLEEMILRAEDRPATTEATSISWYDKDSNRMLIHFGGREIVALGVDGVELMENGTNGVVFKPVPRADPLATKLLPIDHALGRPAGSWWEELLPIEHLNNLTRGNPEEISALLHVWTIFFLFRNIAASRPILMFLAAAGSGKTTLSKKLHLLFYGNGVKLFEVKSQDWWTTTVSNYPLALFDNVDTPTPWWLPPALALAITPTDATKRSLYSNNTPYTMRMDAMIGLSSHDAAFLKDDVIDRAILVQMARIDPEKRLEETPMLEAILRNREHLLAGLLADVVHVLRTPKPAPLQGSVIRIVDFAAIGGWIARGIGKEDAFNRAIGTLSIHQQAKVLEEDIGLVLALEGLQKHSALAGEWCTHTQLWTELLSLAEDNGEGLRSQYKNAQIFGRKLMAIATQLRDAIGFDIQDDPDRGWQVFKVARERRKKKS